MNEFTRKESELVDKIHDEVISKINVMAALGTYHYANKDDRQAATTAVIELVKERLSASH
jgi:hypothetical protein